MSAEFTPFFVSAEAAKAVFDWKDAVGALQEAYALPFGPGACPPRTVAATDGAWVRTLPSNPPGSRYFGAKLMAASMSVPDAAVEYVIVLFDRANSRLAGFLDANLITGYRTAATSASALDRIAPKKPARLAVIGSGLEATMHVRAFAAVRELTEITVFSTTEAKREAFARAAEADLGVPARAVDDPREAVASADIVLTAARSHDEKPIMYADWLPETAVLVSIGSTIPQQREIDVSVVERADLIVCDMLEEVLHETGDMLAAKKAGVDIDARAVSLNDVMSGALDDRLAAAKRPMFKSVGGGVQDVIVGGMVFDRAIEAGLAVPLPMQFERKPL